MMKSIIIVFFMSLVACNTYTQSTTKDNGNINLHFGTLAFYNTYSLGYESVSIVKTNSKHQIRFIARVGGWNASLINENIGIQASIGVSYLLGNGDHLFEHSSEIVNHFDKGLKEQSVVYIGSLYRAYLGYRYQPKNKKIIAKIGVGWKELIQIGLGYRL